MIERLLYLAIGAVFALAFVYVRLLVALRKSRLRKRLGKCPDCGSHMVFQGELYHYDTCKSWPTTRINA